MRTVEKILTQCLVFQMTMILYETLIYTKQTQVFIVSTWHFFQVT